MPRGGARVGAGRKRKDAAAAALHGSRQRSVVRFPQTSAPEWVSPPAAVAAGPVEMPKGLPGRARAVWRRLAPFALAAGTLTEGTAAAFAMLCRAVVIERSLGLSHDAGKASHRGMMQRCEAGYLRFGLAPNGKPMAQAPKVEDPFAQFDQGQTG